MTTAQDTLTILHLGLGSFHRAHQALYLHQLHQLGDTRWVLAGGNLRPDMQDTIAALQAQGGAYTLETVTAQGERSYTRVESIRTVVPYTPDLAGLIAIAAQPGTRAPRTYHGPPQKNREHPMGLTVDVLQDLELRDLQAAARAALQETNAIALIELLEMLWRCDVEGANAVIDAVLLRLQQLRGLR